MICYKAPAVSAMPVYVIVILFFCPRDCTFTSSYPNSERRSLPCGGFTTSVKSSRQAGCLRGLQYARSHLLHIVFVLCMQTLKERGSSSLFSEDPKLRHVCTAIWQPPPLCMCKRSPHLACASSHGVGALELRSRTCKPSRATHAEDRSMRQPRAPVSPLEVQTLHAITPARMITAIIQAERLAADHRQGSI
jgi:hypothetical protein